MPTFSALAPVRRMIPAVMAAAILTLDSHAASADVMELLSGARLEGTVTRIDKEAREVVFSHERAGRTYSRTYTYDKLHAVTLGGQRYVLNAMPAAAAAPSSTAGTPSPARASSGAGNADVHQLIQQMGTTPPDWFEATPLKYPDSLDLSWPQQPPKGWNNQRNVGQYLWDVVYPNPGRWKEGVRLLHHLLNLHQDDAEVRGRVMNTLGKAYHDLLEDYARAAFWWQQAEVAEPNSRFPGNAPKLAACYYRLGDKSMAVALLDRLERTAPSQGLIKIWGDVGEPDRAIRLTEGIVRGMPQDKGVHALFYVMAGDACRTNQMIPDAIRYYERALAAPATGHYQKRIQREQQRARANMEAVKLFELCDPTRVPDGTYQASSLGYAGQVQVAVTVEGGRITAVEVTRHQEKQFYSALTDTPAKIVRVQGVQGVDATSSATITSEAIINATAKALAAAVNGR